MNFIHLFPAILLVPNTKVHATRAYVQHCDVVNSARSAVLVTLVFVFCLCAPPTPPKINVGTKKLCVSVPRDIGHMRDQH